MYDKGYYSTHYPQRQAMSRPGMAGFLQGFDGEHLVLSVVSAMAMYAAGYIIARLFFSGIMFFLSVGLIVFLVMQVVDVVDSGVGAAKYRHAY